MGSVFSRFSNRNTNCGQNIDNKENSFSVDFDINNKGLLNLSLYNRKPSMDVMKHNFIEILSQLEEVINDCEFITIDTELSGLRREWKSLSLLDSQIDRYFKLKESISGYQLIQFGLTCFKQINKNNSNNECKYNCNSYNFYVFPQKSSSIPKANGDRTFSVQSSSLSFLVNNGFDFNKLIKDGISYLNREEEKTCLEAIKCQTVLSADNSGSVISSAITDEDKKFVAEILEKIESFISDESIANIDLLPCNGFKRKLIYETLKSQQFNDSIEIKTIPVSNNSFDRYIAINKIDKQEKQRKQTELLTEAIGFSKVIHLLIKYQKPIIGHNLLLDLMHTFNQFIEPLPKDYNLFKQSIHSLFPVIYDTKHISSSNLFKDLIENTALGDLFSRLNKPPFKPIEVNLLNGVFIEGKALHEAGYDSYLTGLCFIKLVQYLGSLLNPKINYYDSVLMNDYRNKLYLTYALDIRFLNFENEDIIPERNHVFHVSFPNDWKTNELYHLFSAFGGVTISWINDTSAFCALKDQNNIEKIKKSLVKQSSNTYKVISYYDFIKKTISQNELLRDNIKQNSKNRASPEKLNPTKKTKVIDTSLKETPKLNQQKLFEEPEEWELN